jgi:hypothetical protein
VHAHANPVVWEVRIFDSDSDGFERREADKIRAVCLARRMSNDDECFISMMFGKFGHTEMTEVLKEAKAWGMKKIWFERAGKLRNVVVK